jgi:transcriptional regulator with XRE-family HTH domain
MSLIAESAACDSRPAFGQLLRGWRSARKRSQLELALDAGVSQRHLSFLESGRAMPSREMILQLSEVLDLPLRERNQMLNAAGFAALYQQRSLDSEAMSAVRQALQMMLRHHEPFPALVIDPQWNMLMSNTATERFLGLLGNPEEVWQRADPSGNRNVMRLTFHPQGMQPLLNDWDSTANVLLSRLHREVTAAPANTGLRSVFEEISELPGTPGQWRNHIWDSTPPPFMPLDINLGGMSLKIFSMITGFGTALDITADELRVETFFPADEFSAQFFHSLAAQANS